MHACVVRRVHIQEDPRCILVSHSEVDISLWVPTTAGHPPREVEYLITIYGILVLLYESLGTPGVQKPGVARSGSSFVAT